MPCPRGLQEVADGMMDKISSSLAGIRGFEELSVSWGDPSFVSCESS